MPRVSLGLLLLALLLVLVGAGCAGYNYEGPPNMSSIRLRPRFLRFTGGEVTIRTWVRGSRGDATGVSARAVSDSQTLSIALSLNSNAPGTVSIGSNGFYEGTFAVPANSGTEAVTYHVTISAVNYDGETAEQLAGTFVVQPASAPPAPPEER